MVRNNVFEVVKKAYIKPGTKVIYRTWACKKKSNGTLRGRLNSRGLKQIDGQYSRLRWLNYTRASHKCHHCQTDFNSNADG